MIIFILGLVSGYIGAIFGESLLGGDSGIAFGFMIGMLLPYAIFIEKIYNRLKLLSDNKDSKIN